MYKMHCNKIVIKNAFYFREMPQARHILQRVFNFIREIVFKKQPKMFMLVLDVIKLL